MSVEIVKQMFDAFGRGDVVGIASLVSEDCQWDHREAYDVPVNGLFTGPDGVAEFFRILGETQENTVFETDEFLEVGNRVVVLGRYGFRVRETGKEWVSDYAMTYTVENGLVTHWKPIHDMGAEAVAYGV
jgi:ketosteroid isomerase-like protein